MKLYVSSAFAESNNRPSDFISIGCATDADINFYMVEDWQATSVKASVSRMIIPVLNTDKRESREVIVSRFKQYLLTINPSCVDMEVLSHLPEHLTNFFRLFTEAKLDINIKRTLVYGPVRDFSKLPYNALEDAKGIREGLKGGFVHLTPMQAVNDVEYVSPTHKLVREGSYYNMWVLRDSKGNYVDRFSHRHDVLDHNEYGFSNIIG